MSRAAIMMTLLLASGCFNPNPQDGAFKCDSANQYLCPTGLSCNLQKGLCQRAVGNDMALGALSGGGDGGVSSSLPMCDVLVRAGRFANPTLLAISGAGDDSTVSISSDGTKLVFAAGATPTIATIGSDPHSVTGAQALTLTGAPAGLVFGGGAFGKDGSFWLAGFAGTTGQLYASTLSGSTLTVGTAHSPATHCNGPFLTDPVFVGFDPTAELFASGPLAGCTSGGEYVISGVVDRDFGGFVAAIGAPGFRAPALTPSGLTLLVASVGAGATIHVATRGGLDTQFGGVDLLLANGVLGTGSRDAQLVVHPGCAVAYLVSQRAGGKGGLDLWTLDIM